MSVNLYRLTVINILSVSKVSLIDLASDFMCDVFVGSRISVILYYMVMEHKTVLEFTISSGKLFHLLIVLTQNEIILNVLKALGFFISLNYHAFECLRIRTVHSGKCRLYYAQS